MSHLLSNFSMSKVKWVVFAYPKSYFLSLGLFLPGLNRLS